jgi:hypothetical protein
MSTAWQIGNPQYVKDAPGSLPYYVFNITEAAEYPETPLRSARTISASIMSAITPAILGNYLLSLYSAFLNVHKTRFAKPYTPAQLIRVTQHTVNVEDEIADEDEELQWSLAPSQIVVKEGTFTIVWSATGSALKIDLGPEDGASATNEIVEVDEPVGELTDGFLRLTSDTQVDERRGVEEARIKAKWAQYKAQRAIAKYVEKYGDFDEEILSDSESGDESE